MPSKHQYARVSFTPSSSQGTNVLPFSSMGVETPIDIEKRRRASRVYFAALSIQAHDDLNTLNSDD
jgi:hypothetical protein